MGRQVKRDSLPGYTPGTAQGSGWDVLLSKAPMSPIGDHRIVIVLGKGGVGKSVVAGALGLQAANSGQKTLIAEMNGQETQATLWERPHVGYEGQTLCEGLDAVSITPAAAVEEYLVRALKFRALYDLVFRNRYIEPLMNGILGLSDLCSIGKVMDLEWHRRSGAFGPDSQGPYRHDLIVVDAPATGHGLAMLRSPQAMMEITRVGPLFQNAKLIRDLICDHEKCSVVLVTLPEELPVMETIEAAAVLRDQLQIKVAGVIVNAMPADQPSPDPKRWEELQRVADASGGHAAAAVESVRRAERRRRRAEKLVALLERELNLPLLELPELNHHPLGQTSLGELAGILETWT